MELNPHDHPELRTGPLFRPPSSQISSYNFCDESITLKGKYAEYVPGSEIDRLYVIGATEISIEGEDLTPPSQYDKDTAWNQMAGFSWCRDNANDIIIYFLPSLARNAVRDAAVSDHLAYEDATPEQLTPFPQVFAVLELHELTHLYIPEEDNEHDPDHWSRWNSVLRDVVEYVTPGEIPWAAVEYTVKETDHGIITPVGMHLDQTTPVPDTGTQNTITEYATQPTASQQTSTAAGNPAEPRENTDTEDDQ